MKKSLYTNKILNQKVIWTVLFALVFGSNLFVVKDALAQCANPVGAAGDMTYNDNEHVMQWCDGTNWYGTGKSPYIPNAVHFDGVNDDLQHGVWSGVNDCKSWSGSAWVRRNTSGVQHVILDAAGSSYFVQFNSSDELEFKAVDTSPIPKAQILRISSSGTITDTDWHHIMWSFDLTNPANRHIYIDDVDQMGVVTNYTDANMDLDYFTDNRIGSYGSGGYFDGDVADLWNEFCTYIDFSIEANRRQFIDANGWPVDLGADGSRPTGTMPDIFLSGDTAAWHTNKGTGGGFTENGTLTTAGSSPAANWGPLDGLVGWWKFDESTGTTAFDSSGLSNDGALVNGAGALTFDADSIRGIIDGALYFDLQTPNPPQQVQVIGGTNFPTGVSPETTISFWLYGSGENIGNNDNVMRYGGDGTANNYMVIQIDSSGADFKISYFGGNQGAVIPSTLRNTGWRHFTFVQDATTTYHYVDGSLSNSHGNTFDFDVGDLNINSGSSNPAFTFNGAYDDVRIYDRALSAAEVTELYNTAFPCQNPTGQRDGDTMYNVTDHVPQYCNLREWTAMDVMGGDGGAGCSNPTGVEGDTSYNTTFSVMTYCEGDVWRAMGKF